jgi:hypothetical protein
MCRPRRLWTPFFAALILSVATGRFQGILDLKSDKWRDSSAHKTNEFDALQTAYQDNLAQYMIVAADSARTHGNFADSVFSSEEQKASAR